MNDDDSRPFQFSLQYLLFYSFIAGLALMVHVRLPVPMVLLADLAAIGLWYFSFMIALGKPATRSSQILHVGILVLIIVSAIATVALRAK